MTSTVNSDARSKVDEARVGPEVFADLTELLEEQRQVLLVRAAEIMDDIDDLQTLTATHGQGETDMASNDVELATTLKLEASTFAALQEIGHALARLEDGSYGLCAACGEPINAERLKALPHARHCVTCQQAWERRRR